MKEKRKSFKLRIKQNVSLTILFGCLFGILSLCLSPLGTYSGHAANVTLSWNPNSEADLAGYKVYSGTSSGNYSGATYDAGKFTSIGISGLEAGKTYYFAAKAYNTTGLLSNYSNQVNYTVPTTTTTTTTTSTSTTSSTSTATAKTYYLTPYITEGKSYGAVSPSERVYVPAGSSYTFYIKPTTGHYISGVWVDQVYVGKPTSYTFKNIQAKHYMVVKFK
jgi:Fibronectin type III domain.